jgi:parallel beta-helix repeat protein/predicted outer membrane repeat protein
MRSTLLLTVILAGLATSATSAVVTVDGAGGGDYLTIQEGLDAAADTDTVLVAAGTYSGPGNRDLDFGAKNIVLRSISGLTSTTIDCELVGRGIYLHGGQDTTCVIEGFTFANGYAWTCNEAWGGAVLLDNASPFIRLCTFTNCSAAQGGGVYSRDSSPVFLKCRFTECDADIAGGLMCENSSPRVTYCTFSDNIAMTGGFGGGMCCYNYGHAILQSCTFTGNTAGQGGGFRIQMNSAAELTDCHFSGNTATYAGGGVHCTETSSSVFTQCSFAGNHADTQGGGVGAHNCGPQLTECTFFGNSSILGGAVNLIGSDAEIVDCEFLSGISPGACGGVYVHYGSDVTITGCEFSENTYGGLYINDSYALVEDCVFVRNSNTDGAGIECSASSPTITGCTFYANSCSTGGSAVYCGGSSSPMLSNCVMAFSQAGYPVRCHSEFDLPVLSCCNMFGNEGGDWTGPSWNTWVADQADTNGNMSTDPLFCDQENDDLTLCEESPCLAQWNSCVAQIGAFGQGCGLCEWTGADDPSRNVSWGAIKSMFR